MRGIITAGVVVSFVAAASADSEIEYFDEAGTQVLTAKGELIEESPKEIVLKTSDEELRIPVYRVEAIKYEDQPTEMLNAIQLERQNNHEKAIEQLESIAVKVDKTLNDYLYRSVQAGIFRNMAQMGMLDSSKLKDAIDWYEKNKDDLLTSRHYYPALELAGQLYMRQGDFAKAQDAFDVLGGAGWPGYKEKALVYAGLAALAQKKESSALDAFKEVIDSTSDAPLVTEQKLIARIATAETMLLSGDATKAAQAEELSRTIIDELTAEDRQDMMARARNTLGDALRIQNKLKEAVLDGYMWVHILYSRDANEHARAMFHLAALFPEIGYPAHGEEMKARLVAEYGQSEWAKRLDGDTKS